MFKKDASKLSPVHKKDDVDKFSKDCVNKVKKIFNVLCKCIVVQTLQQLVDVDIWNA